MLDEKVTATATRHASVATTASVSAEMDIRDWVYDHAEMERVIARARRLRAEVFYRLVMRPIGRGLAALLRAIARSAAHDWTVRIRSRRAHSDA